MGEQLFVRGNSQFCAVAALRRDVHSAVANGGDLEITFHYNGDPVLLPGIERAFEVSLQQREQPVDADIMVDAPAGWTVSIDQRSPGRHRLNVLARDVTDRNSMTIRATLPDGDRTASFTILGPGEAKGFPSGQNVAPCPTCGARETACICGEQ